MGTYIEKEALLAHFQEKRAKATPTEKSFYSEIIAEIRSFPANEAPVAMSVRMEQHGSGNCIGVLKGDLVINHEQKKIIHENAKEITNIQHVEVFNA